MCLDPAQKKQKHSSNKTHRQDGKQCTWPKVLSYKEAEIQFKSWEVDPKAHGILSCVSDGYTYLRISTGMHVNFDNIWQRKKEVEVTSKVVKNPTGELIKEVTSEFAMGHNMFGKADFDMMKTAGQMLQKTGGNAFNDEGLSLPDIKKLLPDDVAKDDSDSDHGENRADDKAKGSDNDKAKGSDKGDDSKDKDKDKD